MTNPSIKNVSASDLEAALAQALSTATGWDKCRVEIQVLSMSEHALCGTEDVGMTLRVNFSADHSKSGMPF